MRINNAQFAKCVMLISELFALEYRYLISESVYQILDNITRPVVEDDEQILAALVMFVQANNERPGIVQLNCFYTDDNTALIRELTRLTEQHPDRFAKALSFVASTHITDVLALIRNFFETRQNNVDMVPHPARPQGPVLPQRPVGGDQGRMRIAGR